MAVAQAPITGFDQLEKREPSTERMKRLKARCRWKHVMAGEYVDPDTKAGMERMRIITKAYKENEGQPEVIKRAKFLEYTGREHSCIIQDEEIIVGYHAENPDWVCLYPDMGYNATIDIIESDLMDEEYKDEAREIAEWWKPRNLQGKCEPYFTKEELELGYGYTTVEPFPFVLVYMSMNVPYRTLFEDGLEKRIQICQEKIDNAFKEYLHTDVNRPYSGERWRKDDILHKIDNWRAFIIAAKGIITWSRRYARLARIIADHFDVPAWRREELRKIADVCWHCMAKPARGFWDAMQAKYFAWMLGHSYERYSSGYAHLEDDILWPYYKKSVYDKDSEQPLTKEQCLELLEQERLKVSERGIAKGRTYRVAQPGANDLHIITIGGVDEENRDACNELTDLILEAILNMSTPEPSYGFRWHPNINLKTKRLVFECIRRGFGFPAIFNHDIKKWQLEYYYNVSRDEAARWALQLCMSPGRSQRYGTQKTRTQGGGYDYVASKCLEMALSDGFDYSYTKKQIGPKTGDPTKFKSIEEIWKAFETQCRYACRLHARARDITRYMEAHYLQCPIVSILDDACVEKGLDCMEDYDYPNPWSNMMHNSDIADSFAAMEKLIFEEKKYTMEDLVKALRANWEGYEEMRRDFLAAPKWGNDDDYVDKWMRRYYEMNYQIMHEETTYIDGGKPLPLPQTVSLYASLAPFVGALPYGRKHGEVLGDGGISPYVGMDKKGPTAVLKSVSKVDHRKTKGVQFNQRLSHQIMRGEKGFQLWLSYMDAWWNLNIDHVQFNVFNTNDLRAAQKEPEKYEDLIVRIAGYSARFISLPRIAQDAVIARTEQELGA